MTQRIIGWRFFTQGSLQRLRSTARSITSRGGRITSTCLRVTAKFQSHIRGFSFPKRQEHHPVQSEAVKQKMVTYCARVISYIRRRLASNDTAKAEAVLHRTKSSPIKRVPIQRFAHPFFEFTPANSSSPQPADAAAIATFSQQHLEQIPAPKRKPPEMTLDDVIGHAGAAAVKASGKMIFHAFGDSGNPQVENQEMVADAMTAEYDTTQPAASPAFLFHMGDVIYYDNTDAGYHAQFYAPYKRYPGKIIAIPGNHDGELFKFDGASTGQKKTLAAFQRNFCQPTPTVPPAAGSIYRQMVSQPGVYWRLDAPFADVLGLYSNVGETSGFISDPQIGTAQKAWLVATIKRIVKARTTGPRKALILAVHHPLYSNGGHEASIGMRTDLDDACHMGGLMPDVVLTAHAHNYQRYTRRASFGGANLEIPVHHRGNGRTWHPVAHAREWPSTRRRDVCEVDDRIWLLAGHDRWRFKRRGIRGEARVHEGRDGLSPPSDIAPLRLGDRQSRDGERRSNAGLDISLREPSHADGEHDREIRGGVSNGETAWNRHICEW